MDLFGQVRYRRRVVDFTVLWNGKVMPREALLIQPGLGGSSKFLLDEVMIREIPSGVCLVTASRPGAGLTTPCAIPGRLYTVMQDVAAVVRELGVRPVASLGHSLGCLYAPHVGWYYNLEPDQHVHLYAPPKIFTNGVGEIKADAEGTGWWHRNMMQWIVANPTHARRTLAIATSMWRVAPWVLLNGSMESVAQVDKELLGRADLRRMFLADTRHYMLGGSAFHDDMAFWLRHATPKQLAVAYGAAIHWGSQDQVVTRSMIHHAAQQRQVDPELINVVEGEGHFLLFKSLREALERALS